MEIDSEKNEQIPSFNEKQKHLEVALRATSVLFILAAFLLMVTDKQTFTFVDVTFSAKFYYSSAFCYYVGATGLLMVYSMVSLIFACRSAPGDAYSFFFLDLLALELMTSAWSATMAVAYIGKIGQNKLTRSAATQKASATEAVPPSPSPSSPSSSSSPSLSSPTSRPKGKETKK